LVQTGSNPVLKILKIIEPRTEPTAQNLWTKLNWTWTDSSVLSVLSSCISSEPNFGITRRRYLMHSYHFFIIPHFFIILSFWLFFLYINTQPTLAGLHPFLLGSLARCTFLSYFMCIYCLGSTAIPQLSWSCSCPNNIEVKQESCFCEIFLTYLFQMGMELFELMNQYSNMCINNLSLFYRYKLHQIQSIIQRLSLSLFYNFSTQYPVTSVPPNIMWLIMSAAKSWPSKNMESHGNGFRTIY